MTNNAVKISVLYILNPHNLQSRLQLLPSRLQKIIIVLSIENTTIKCGSLQTFQIYNEPLVSIIIKHACLQ